MSGKVFINRKPVSKDTAHVVLKLFPNGGTFAEESVYRKIRTITTDMLPKGAEKTPTMVRAEIDRLISEEMTVIISVEGVTCEKCERKVTFEDEHQKAMKKLAEEAEKEHEETLKKRAAKEQPKKEDEKAKTDMADVKESSETKEEKPVLEKTVVKAKAKAPVKKSAKGVKKKPSQKKK